MLEYEVIWGYIDILIIAVRRLRVEGKTPTSGPQTLPALWGEGYPLPLFPTPMSPLGRYTNKLSAYISLSFCKSISRSRIYKSPDPDFSFTRFSQKLGQKVLGYHGCWIVWSWGFWFEGCLLGGGQEWEGEEGCVVLCLYVGRKRGVGSSQRFLRW